MNIRLHRYQHAAANDGAALAGGAGAPSVPNGEPAAASALASGAQGQPDLIPEKYRVLGADGKTVDELASLKKLAADGYAPLAKRLGSGDLPPTKAEEYKFAAPQGFEQTKFDEFVKDPETQSFVKEAHAKGFTNDQLNFVMSKWLERAPQLAEGAQALTVDDTIKNLKDTWKEEAEFSKNMGAAYRASVALGQKLNMSFQDLETAGLGNNPTFIRLMAALAPELAEDNPPGGQGGGGANIDEQIKELDDKLSKLPRHSSERSALVEQKLALYERKFPTKK